MITAPGPDRWGRLKDVFGEAAGLDPAGRAALLARVAEDDPWVAAEASELLDEDARAAGFLESPAAHLEAPRPPAPKRIGPYEVVRELGEGGMGTVYLASRSDREYSSLVAIKILRAGYASTFFVRRFRTERQILAALAHPNIARLFDGGTTEDGLPYFVMEYVDGEPIHAYCERQALARDARLSLFLDVCGAVQHAHRHLVVHRDLKPGNVLVTSEGAVKLLDFGLAKLLGPLPLAPDGTPEKTATGLALMTPEYASPEQVRGEPVTTASDVYSLGVLLYELLTGRLPYRLESRLLPDVLRTVCEEPPAPPHGVPEDLEAVLGKALRKEPERRYGSVEQLAEDVRRHRRGLPVEARPDTLTYRTRKFVIRHRVALTAALMAVAALGASTVFSLRSARAARRSEALADRRFAELRRLSSTHLFDVHDAIRTLPGATQARRLVVKTAVDYLDALARDSADDRSLQRDLADAYHRLGDLQDGAQAGFLESNLGDGTGALASYRKAVLLRQSVAAAEPGSVRDLRALGTSWDRLGLALVHRSDPRGQTLLARAFSLRRSLSRQHPDDEPLLHELAESHHSMAACYAAAGDVAALLQARRAEVALGERLVRIHPDHPAAHRALAVAQWSLGPLLAAEGEKAEGLELSRHAVALCEERARRDAASAEARLDLSESLASLASTLGSCDQPAAARQAAERALSLAQAAYAGDPSDARARLRLAGALRASAALRFARADAAGAEKELRRALALLTPAHQADPRALVLRSNVVSTWIQLADVLVAQGRCAAARDLYARARDNARELLAVAPRHAKVIASLERKLAPPCPPAPSRSAGGSPAS